MLRAGGRTTKNKCDLGKAKFILELVQAAAGLPLINLYHIAHAMIVSTGLRRFPGLLLTFLVATVAALQCLREAILEVRGVTIG